MLRRMLVWGYRGELLWEADQARWRWRVGGERAWVDWEIQSASGTGRRTFAREEGEAVLAGWPVEEVRGGMALGDCRKLLDVEIGGGVMVVGSPVRNGVQRE